MDTIGTSALGWVIFSAGVFILFIVMWTNRRAPFVKGSLNSRRDNLEIRAEWKEYVSK
jgi:hypothetical protein